jgi:hypothetical protein
LVLLWLTAFYFGVGTLRRHSRAQEKEVMTTDIILTWLSIIRKHHGGGTWPSLFSVSSLVSSLLPKRTLLFQFGHTLYPCC